MTTYQNFQITATSATRRIECKNLFNTVEISYHDWDELADSEEEAIEFFIEWLEETKEDPELYLNNDDTRTSHPVRIEDVSEIAGVTYEDWTGKYSSDIENLNADLYGFSFSLTPEYPVV